jgi:alpha-galactosidase
MLRHYLRWWVEHREVLLNGKVRAPRPDLGYPVVASVQGDRSVAVAYSPAAAISVSTRRTIVANATGADSLLIELPGAASFDGVLDCFGAPQPGGAVELSAGVHRLAVPRGGSGVIDCEVSPS